MSKEILAVVAGKEITNQDVDAFVQNLPQQQQAYASHPQFRQQVVTQLINNELFGKKAQEDKLEETEEFQKEMATIKASLLSNIAMTKVLESVSVTEDEVKACYEENKAQFVQPASASAQHILTETEEECLTAAKEIEAGDKTFEEAAEAYSTCPSKAQGGDLGTFGKGQMVKEFEDAVFTAELNKVIGPVKTQFGYHLIKVSSLTEEKTSDFEDVKAQVEAMALQQKQHKEFDAVAAVLADKYGVEMK